VVETLELGEQDGTLYLAMEWVDGEPLQAILKQTSERSLIPLPIAINLVGQACKGLHAAHELSDDAGTTLGLVHRDISPHNILVCYSGNVKLVDFGIAKVTSRNSGLTEAGQVKGKCAYMAPEQMKCETVDRRADVFGMGIVLYQLTTGRHPFRGETQVQTIQNIVSPKPPILPSLINRDYPKKLELVVLKALKKDPTQRFGTAHELLEALQQAMPGCLEASFESHVQQFMRGLFAERAAKRKAALKSAQEQLDKQVFEAGTNPGTSPRAWGHEAGTGSGIAAGTGSVGTGSGPQQSSTTQLGAEVPVRAMRPKLLFSLAGGAVAVVALIVLTLAMARPSGSPASGPQSQAHAAAAARRLSPAPSPSPAAVPAPKAEEAVAVPEPEPAAAEEEPRKKSAARRVQAWVPPKTPTAAPPTVLPPPPKSEPEASSPAPKPSAKSAWDPKAFGGRQ
jgi:serine/threonine-protein kinase